jgi:queuine tRNA-ribosyltransferase
MSKFGFKIEKKLKGTLARAGVLSTPHGKIETPAFIVVGTRATVKTLSPEDVRDLGGQAILSNTYHLFLKPGEKIVKKAGGLHGFMNWQGPMFTDSGGFQVFSLGAAFGRQEGKISKPGLTVGYRKSDNKDERPLSAAPAKIDEDGVTFRSHIDGSEHRLTPEKSMQIQRDLGADIIFAFDECTSPSADYAYQKEAMDRTHRWAKRCLDARSRTSQLLRSPTSKYQALFGIVQGGRYKDLREESAKIIGAMPFDGFGIGGSFDKEDMGTAVRWVNSILPEDKPRHLLGIGEVEDLFLGVENGADTFDCVSPTRLARNGTIFTRHGRMTITKSIYKQDFKPIEKDCGCYTCRNFKRAYLHHLFKEHELLVYRLASIHNLYFTVNLVKKIRTSIIDGNFIKFKKQFLSKYTH